MPQSVVIQQPSPNSDKLGKVTLVKIDTFTIPANSNKIYQVGISDHLFLQASTNSTAGSLTFSFDDQNAQGLLVGQIVAAPVPFKTVQIANTTNGIITYTVIIANGPIDFKGLIISGAINIQNVQNANGTYNADITTGAAAQVFASATNLAIILCADPSNTDQVYIGFDNSVAANKKVIALSPGAIYVFNSYSGALFAFSTLAQKLSVSSM